ncbi:pyruvate dehydrogenase complex dehydrogenase (E1) component [Pseudomonas laurylsulfatiphila]
MVFLPSSPEFDPVETQEWLESFQSAQIQDPNRALYLLGRLDQFAKEAGLAGSSVPYSSYRNTISLEKQGAYA